MSNEWVTLYLIYSLYHIIYRSSSHSPSHQSRDSSIFSTISANPTLSNVVIRNPISFQYFNTYNAIFSSVTLSLLSCWHFISQHSVTCKNRHTIKRCILTGQYLNDPTSVRNKIELHNLSPVTATCIFSRSC